MKINTIHIRSFGGLSDHYLKLEPGFNRIFRPNEGGKSTLIHFIYFILYGYDAKKLKTYFPWQGGPLSGFLELEAAGEGWRIDRIRPEKGTEKCRVFRQATGEEITLPARQQPGPYFLGLDGETFLRSFCLRQEDLIFRYTDGLDVALKNLASTGDEGVSFEQARKYLRTRRTQYANWGKRGGALDKLQEELTLLRQESGQLQTALKEGADARRQAEEKHQAMKSLDEQIAQQKILLEQARKSDALLLLERWQELEKQKNALAAPSVSKELMYQLTEAFERSANAELEARSAEARREESLARLQYADDALAAYSFRPEDAREIEAAGKKDPLFFTGLILLIASLPAAALGWLSPYLFLIPALGAAAGIALLLLSQTRKQQLCRRFGVASPAELPGKWAQYQELYQKRQEFAAEQENLRRQAAEARESEQKARFTLEELKQKSRILSPGELQDLQVAWRVYETGTGREALSRQQEVLLNGKTLPELQAMATGAARISETAEQVSARLEPLLEEREQLRQQLNAPAEQELARLWEQSAALEQEIARKETEWHTGFAEQEALDQAMDWLEEANREMNTGFSPRLCEKAGQYLAAITDGKYQGLTLDAGFQIRLVTDAGTFEAERFSTGTRDAIYLCFRLAAADLLGQEPLPLILDDPFLTLDHARLQAARSLLEHAAHDRQILYFTCKN